MITPFNDCKSALSNTVILDFVLTPIGVEAIDMCLLGFSKSFYHVINMQEDSKVCIACLILKN